MQAKPKSDPWQLVSAEVQDNQCSLCCASCRQYVYCRWNCDTRAVQCWECAQDEECQYEEE